MPSDHSGLWTPDVFVSYDVIDSDTESFTSILFAKLEQAGIGFRYSCEGTNNLFNAISQARFALVVLTKKYAYSGQCLNELVDIVLRRGNSKYPRLVVIPIFHGIDAGKVIKSGAKEKSQNAFCSLPENEDKKKKDEWERALAKVKGIGGYDLQKNAKGAPSSAAGNCKELVETIVKRLVDEICSLYSFKVFGPFGGSSENPWHFNEISGIQILNTEFIKSVTSKVDASTRNHRHKGKNNRKDLRKVTLDEREDIISFSGQFQKPNDGCIRIQALTFRSRNRELKVGTVDKGREDDFSVTLPVGAGKVIEFFGSQSSDGPDGFLTSIGARVDLTRVELPPFGSRRGSKWDDGDQHTTVKGIRAARDSSDNRCIRSIAFKYDNGEWQPHVSGQEWHMEFIIRDEDEYLSSISGYHICDGITSLTFLTNKKSTITIGDGKGTHFSSPETGCKIVGFYGWGGDECLLYGIGAYFIPIKDLRLAKSIGPFGGEIAWEVGKFKGVKKIDMYSRPNGIRYIRIVYVDNSGKDRTFSHGDYTEASSRMEETINLDHPQEYLTWISGYKQDYGSIKSLTLHSNRKKICFGTPSGRGYFGYPSNKSRIIGFYGTWGKTLSSIGVYEELIPDWEPFKHEPDGFRGSGGDDWDDGEHSNVVGYRVTTIGSSNESKKIESITFMYENNGSLVEGSRRGGEDPSSDKWVMLDYPEERLLRIRGYWRKEAGETIIHDLKIVTTASRRPLIYAKRGEPDSDSESTSTSKPKSEQCSKRFTIPEKPEGRRIVGFFGKAKTCLNFIGAYLEP